MEPTSARINGFPHIHRRIVEGVIAIFPWFRVDLQHETSVGDYEIAIIRGFPMIPCFPRHARRIRLEWRTVRSIVKRILVTCAATTALALLLTMVLCALGNAMAPKWQVEPFTDHITLTTTNRYPGR